MEQILPDRNISESDPLANVANNSSTLIFRTLQYIHGNATHHWRWWRVGR